VLIGGADGGSYCSKHDSFEVRMRDLHGDGFCCEHGRGVYELKVDGQSQVRQIGDFIDQVWSPCLEP
jgi:hypothetical protein